MRLFSFISLLFLALTSTAQTSEAYLGQFLYKHESSNIYRVTVNDAQSMLWVCVEGSEKGANGIEKSERFKVNNKIFFVTWVEKTGIHVSQVVDLENMKVYSTIIDGKERFALAGKILREK